MANMFSKIIRCVFGNKSSDNVIAKNDSSDNDDGKYYLDFDLIEKKEFIHLESAYQNQEYVFRRATESNRLVLGEILEQVFNIEKSSILSMAVAYRLGDFGNDITEKILEAPNDIWNFDMFSCIIQKDCSMKLRLLLEQRLEVVFLFCRVLVVLTLLSICVCLYFPQTTLLLMMVHL